MTETAVATPDPEEGPEQDPQAEAPRELKVIATPEDIFAAIPSLSAETLPNPEDIAKVLVPSLLEYIEDLTMQLTRLVLTGRAKAGDPIYVFIYSVIADITEMVGASFGFDFKPYFDNAMKAANGESQHAGPDTEDPADGHSDDDMSGPKQDTEQAALRAQFEADQAAAEAQV